MIPKQHPIRSKKLRESARGEDCTLQLEGICNGDPDTVILAHLPDESGGMSRKSDDISACFACYACHSHIDQYRSLGNARDWYLRRAMVRTWRRLVAKGVIQIKGYSA